MSLHGRSMYSIHKAMPFPMSARGLGQEQLIMGAIWFPNQSLREKPLIHKQHYSNGQRE